MKKTKLAFTMIEVTLFLAISSAVAIAIMSGVSSSLRTRRYNDSVNDFVDFLRNAYSQTVNVQTLRPDSISSKTSCTLEGASNSIINETWDVTPDPNTSHGLAGRTNCAVYGKLLTFGENDKDKNTVHVYDVIGLTLEEERKDSDKYIYSFDNAMSPLEALNVANSDILTIQPSGTKSNPVCTVAPAGDYYSYNLQWLAEVEDVNHNAFRGSVLIARSPTSGTVHTYAMTVDTAANPVIEASEMIGQLVDNCRSTLVSGSFKNKLQVENRILLPRLNADNFQQTDVDFCINSDDARTLGVYRRNVRITADGHNAAAVKLVNSDYLTDDDDDPERNRCV